MNNFIKYLKKKIVEIFFSPPKFVINFLPLNLLGFQIFRLFFFNSKIQFKKFLIKKEYQNVIEKKILYEIEKKGFVIIENFFSKDECSYIKEITEKLTYENIFNKTKYGNADVLIGPLNLTSRYKNEVNAINKLFLKKNVNKIISQIIGQKINYFPTSTFQKINLKENLIDENDNNSEYHPDRFYPCVKSFFYINKNDIDNGAFGYYPESHKIFYERLKYEYLHSIFHKSNLSDNFYSKFNFVKINGRITLNENKLNNLFGPPVICSAPENSFVISNNMGFHKRGKLKPKHERIHLRNDYYDFQINKFLRMIKEKYRQRNLT